MQQKIWFYFLEIPEKAAQNRYQMRNNDIKQICVKRGTSVEQSKYLFNVAYGAVPHARFAALPI